MTDPMTQEPTRDEPIIDYATFRFTDGFEVNLGRAYQTPYTVDQICKWLRKFEELRRDR